MATYDFLHLFPLKRYKQQDSNWFFFVWLPTYEHAGRWFLSQLLFLFVLRNFVSVLCFINVTVHRSSDKKYKQKSLSCDCDIMIFSFFSCIILFFGMKNNSHSIVRAFFSCSNATSVSLMFIPQVRMSGYWPECSLLY